MASGRFHRSCTIAATPVAALLAYGATRDLTLAGFAGAGCLVGLVVHPDLDLSRAWLWRPYSKMLKHRSPWSHWPILSTIVRALYLIGWATILLLPLSIAWLAIGGWIQPPAITERDWASLGIGLAGLTISDSLHWAVDKVSTKIKREVKRKGRRGRRGLFAG